MTINSTVDDRITNSRYFGIIVETTNITVEKMLITYLALQQRESLKLCSLEIMSYPLALQNASQQK